jgi:hypothetical protein
MQTKILKLVLALVACVGLAAAATIPAGTKIYVRTTTSMNSGTARAGQTWEGSLDRDLVVNGSTIAHKGDAVKGTVTLAKDSGRLHAPGQLTLRVNDVAGTAVSSSPYHVTGKSHTKSNAEKIGGGAAAGALIGALAGGGKGAAIGAGVGAGAGTGVAMYTGKQQAVIPAESLVTFTVSSNVSAAQMHHRRH